MSAEHKGQSLAKHIVLVASILLLVIFGALTLVVTQLSQRAALHDTEQTLSTQVNTMKLQLDSDFENVRERGERSSTTARASRPPRCSPSATCSTARPLPHGP